MAYAKTKSILMKQLMTKSECNHEQFEREPGPIKGISDRLGKNFAESKLHGMILYSKHCPPPFCSMNDMFV